MIAKGTWHGALRLISSPNRLESAAYFTRVVLTLIAFTGLFADMPIPPPDCWPWWQCNNTDKSLNHPNCKCWDGK